MWRRFRVEARPLKKSSSTAQNFRYGGNRAPERKSGDVSGAMRMMFNSLKGAIIAVAGLTLLLLQTACGSQHPPTAASTPLPAPPTRPAVGNTPSFPGANLLISIVGLDGQPVEEGTLEVSIEYEGDLAYLDDSYSVDVATISNGLLGMHPPPTRHPATLFIQVKSPAGVVSDRLVVKNTDFWNAVDAERDYVAIHRFQLGKSDVTSDLAYLASP